MSKLIKGVNDLKTLNPELAMEWDAEKNTDRNPEDVMPGSGIRVWWKCKEGHSWDAIINTRAVRGNGCPYCEGRKAWPGFNDLATTMPEVAAQWDYERNGDLKPTEILSGCDKRVWWKCSRGHSWKTAVYHRKSGHGCPKCEALSANLKQGENDLASHDLELASEWDYDKNIFKPEELSYASKQEIWWRCVHGHSWKATINARVFRKRGCPYCAGQQVWQGFNDLATTHPELAAEWDYEKNAGLIPEEVTAGKDMKAWWRCPRGHSWEAFIYSRKAGSGCPVCSGNTLLPGFNDLATVKPELVSEWDYDRNTDMTPDTVSAGTSRKAWWKCDKGHGWRASIVSRVGGNNCPVCAGKMVIKGVNDLESINPLLAGEWDFERNSVTPDSVTAGSSKKFWWKCSKGHGWRTTVAARMGGTGCPFCVGKEIMPGLNDLKTMHPDVVDNYWDYGKNADVNPNTIASSSKMKVWWKCGKGHSWKSKVCDAVHNGCPICSNRRVLVGYNDLKSVHPELAAEWDYENNGCLTPEKVTYSTGRKVHWICSVSHRYELSVYSRHTGVGCPYCSGRQALKGFNSLADQARDYTNDWDYERNVDISPDEILPFSNRKIWWKCPNGHSYRSNLNAHNKGHGCPYCSGQLPSRTRIVP
ncbi:MAG: zinc-ribbon domain-containing protein [Butyrivibrio sp.]|nr:zinc-ribbon domain-containing protein [Butyrivibrio sp.]